MNPHDRLDSSPEPNPNEEDIQDFELMTANEVVEYMLSAWTHPSQDRVDLILRIVTSTTPDPLLDDPWSTMVHTRTNAILSKKTHALKDDDAFASDLNEALATPDISLDARRAVEILLKFYSIESEHSGPGVSNKLLRVWGRVHSQIQAEEIAQGPY